MKVFLMLPEMDVGGVEEGTFDLAKGMKRLGIDISVISGHGKYIPLLKEEGIKWINIPTVKKTPIVFFKSFKKLKSIIDVENPDILHCRSRFPAWIGYYALQGNKKTKFVTSIHGFYKFPLYSRILARGERVIVISNALRKYAIEKLGAKPDSIRIIHNGIKFEPYISLKRENHKEFIISGIGRFTKLKGFQDLIKAVAIAKKAIPVISLWLIGEGPYKKELETLSIKLNVNVKFFRGKSFEFLPMIDLLVAPHIETEKMEIGTINWLGRIVYEAQLAEVPVLTTLNGIKKETFVKTDTELICAPKDVKAMAEAIMFAFNHPQEMKKLAKNGKDFVINHFSIEQMVDKTIKVYQEIL